MSSLAHEKGLLENLEIEATSLLQLFDALLGNPAPLVTVCMMIGCFFLIYFFTFQLLFNRLY